MSNQPTHHGMNPANNNGAPGGFGIVPGRLSQRLLFEMRDLTENVDDEAHFRFESSGQNGDNFCIDGYLLPQSEPYRNGAFKVRITLTTFFPNQPPQLQLLTPMYHPVVNIDTPEPKFCCTCCSFNGGALSRIRDSINNKIII